MNEEEFVEKVSLAMEVALAKEYDRGFSAGYNVGYEEGQDYALYHDEDW